MLSGRTAGAVLLAVALVWIVLVFQTIDPSQGTEAGPRAFPLFFGIVLALLSGVMFVQGFRPAPQGVVADADAAVPVAPGELTAVLLTIGSLVVYGMLLEPFGFIPSTAFVVTVLLVFGLRVRQPVTVAAMAIGLSLGSYLLFGKLLGVYMPPGHIITIYF
jgi:hypothetical protein